MGEARRRAAQGLPPRQPKASTKAVDTSPRVVSWLPLTRNQTQQFMAVTTRGAWMQPAQPTNENKRKPLDWVSLETQLCFRASQSTIDPLLKTW